MVTTPCFQCRGREIQVPSLVRKLRSHTLCGAVQNKTKRYLGNQLTQKKEKRALKKDNVLRCIKQIIKLQSLKQWQRNKNKFSGTHNARYDFIRGISWWDREGS